MDSTTASTVILQPSCLCLRAYATGSAKLARAAHRLKSSSGNKTIDSLLALKCTRRILLTGTPLQNNLEARNPVIDHGNAACALVQTHTLVVNGGRYQPSSRHTLQPISLIGGCAIQPAPEVVQLPAPSYVSWFLSIFVMYRPAGHLSFQVIA